MGKLSYLQEYIFCFKTLHRAASVSDYVQCNQHRENGPATNGLVWPMVAKSNPFFAILNALSMAGINEPFFPLSNAN